MNVYLFHFGHSLAQSYVFSLFFALLQLVFILLCLFPLDSDDCCSNQFFFYFPLLKRLLALVGARALCECSESGKEYAIDASCTMLDCVRLIQIHALSDSKNNNIHSDGGLCQMFGSIHS